MAKMSKRAEKALTKTIKEKWEGIVYRGEEDLGRKNCELCRLYHKNGCKACPVKQKVDMEGCRNTPYIAWSEHHNKGVCGTSRMTALIGKFKIKCNECRVLAMTELKFLKALLPRR